MVLTAGTRLGPYEIVSRIGAGGMGVVYRALDTRLDRVVAIKTAKEEFPERFAREARAIAALNHPHICQLYDVGPDYLVMEYVEGKAVTGPLPLPEVLRLAAQIADALDAAHSRGIVHRDLKPDNILVTGSGEIKLLDFGLAKMPVAAVAAESDITLTRPLTQQGTILGTLRYMSPEQLQGKEADACSDIFAFGTVLYEMLTGRPAFEAPNPASIVAAILTSDVPAPSTLHLLSPPSLDRLLHRCLAKNPEARWQSARDLGEALKWIAEGAWSAQTTAKSSTRARTIWIAATLCALAAAGLGGHFLGGTRETPRVIRVNVHGEAGAYRRPVVSPDGSRIAFITGDTNKAQLWVRPLSSFQAQRLEGAEDPSDPIWSPDSNEIATSSRGKLQRFDLTGGTRRTICDLPSGGNGFITGSWGASGVILFSDSGTLYRVSASGGQIARVTRVDRSRGELKHIMPYFLPDGRRFLFLAANQRTEQSAIYEGALDTAEVQRILEIPVGPVNVIGKNLVFVRGTMLMAQPFDWQAARLKGEPVSLQENIYAYPGSFNPIASFSASANVLAYYPQELPATELVWFDRRGNRLSSVGLIAHYTNPALSPDQKRIAVGITDPETNQRDIWLLDSHGGAMRFTTDPKEDLNPAWSPDGARIAFGSDRKGARDLFVKSSAGIGAEELLLSSPNQKALLDWSPDGEFLIYGGQGSIMAVSVEGEKKPFAVVAGPGSSDQAAISPDGKWIAYRSSDADRVEIYLQSFPAGGARWQLSTNGGSEPSWRRDGKELYFMRDRQLFAVDIESRQSGIEHGTPKLLFTAPFSIEIRRNRYVPAADGQRFLVVAQSEHRGTQIHIVLNWRASLKDE